MITDQHCSIAGISAKLARYSLCGSRYRPKGKKEIHDIDKKSEENKIRSHTKKIDLFSLSMLV